MKRMTKLAAKLDKAIDIDDEGNIEAGKDVQIDGNLKISSLVSDSNPEGSILTETKKYTDDKIKDINVSEIVQQANEYSDEKLAESKTYTDEKVAAIGSGGVHCYVIQPEGYSATRKYHFAFYTSKDIEVSGTITKADLFTKLFPALHSHQYGSPYFPEITEKVYLEQYPAYGSYLSNQVLFITITETSLYIYTWDGENKKVISTKALSWFTSDLTSNPWNINKLY